MKHIYLFSGLGADDRVFKYLDFSGYEVTFINWLPNEKQESLQNYARRLLGQVKTDNPILIGLSFGGIVAVELAKLIKTQKIILIASVKTSNELPPLYRLIGPLQLHLLLPNWLLVRPNFFIYWLFGVKNKNDRNLLSAILHDTNAVFLKWALGKVANWRNSVMHENLIHIHGTADRIFPFKFVACDIAVEDGGHFMTVNKPKELTSVIRQALTIK